MTAMFNKVLQHTERPYLDRARARPFVKWAGGKRTLIPDIARLLPPEDIETYYEPFVGGGAVFFALDSRITKAELSDVNAELALTYQVVRNNPEPLIDLLRQYAKKHTKPHYLRIRKTMDIATSVELAARFIYLNKTCFNGLFRVNKSGHFNVPMGSYKNPLICDAENIRAVSEVLKKATVKISDFGKIYPSAGDFIYADPPYDKAFNGYNSNGFDRDDQTRLRDAAIRWHMSGAKVMLSNADTELIQSIYGREPFRLHSVSAPKSINCKPNGRGAVGELLITTYDER